MKLEKIKNCYRITLDEIYDLITIIKRNFDYYFKTSKKKIIVSKSTRIGDGDSLLRDLKNSDKLGKYYYNITQDSSYLGEGAYGIVFLTKDNKVIKCTTDLVEIELAEKLKENSFKYIINFHEVIRIYRKKLLIGAIIIKEYVDIFHERENADFWRNLRDFCEKNYICTRNSREWFLECSYNNKELFDSKYSKDFSKYHINLIGDRHKILKELKEIKELYNLRTLDIHPGNFGFTKEGEFKLFDISGYGYDLNY